MKYSELQEKYIGSYLSGVLNDIILTDTNRKKVWFVNMTSGNTVTIEPNKTYIIYVSGNGTLAPLTAASDSKYRIGKSKVLLVVPTGRTVTLSNNFTVEGTVDAGKINELNVSWWDATSSHTVTLIVDEKNNLVGSSYGGIKNAIASNLGISSSILNEVFS